MPHTEAVCSECGETFIPHSDSYEDLEHGVQENGQPCGGRGVIVGTWVYTPEEKN